VRYLTYLLPWQFSPTACVVFGLTLALYVRGWVVLRRGRVRLRPWRALVFGLGLALNYAVLQTYFDFLAQHMFWIHRLQHLILHHIGPTLLILSAPVPILRAGIPAPLWRLLNVPWVRTPLRRVWHGLQHPLIAPVLFVGLIYFWLIPSVHFTAMIDTRRYELMNWSMLIDGILFWWLMLAPREAQGESALRYGVRYIVLTAVALPQIVLGAYIALTSHQLFSIYALCGRAWAISPMLDQQIGGLLTWIPAAMMSAVGGIVVIYRVLSEERRMMLAPRVPATSSASAGATA
jgi:putative membrane protein